MKKPEKLRNYLNKKQNRQPYNGTKETDEKKGISERMNRKERMRQTARERSATAESNRQTGRKEVRKFMHVLP